MKMKKLMGLCLFLLTLFISNFHISNASQLNNNTAVVESIEVNEDGDVIDCVDMYQQPAFNHPLLQNHTLKTEPSYHPEGLFALNNLTESSSNATDQKPIYQLWQLSGGCPDGTVPIRRPKQTDFNGNISFSVEYATISSNGTYYGTKATISVWEPYVERDDEHSSSVIWIVGGDDYIAVGWTVSPLSYGDNRTRLFTLWGSGDNSQSKGCYNMLCPGFVQISNEIALGGSLSTVSTVNGSQSEMSILVWKDEKQEVWWLQYNDIIVGYWPATIFIQLANQSASEIIWGGDIGNSDVDGVHTATQMGSGDFPEEGFGRASYFRNLEVVDESLSLVSAGDLLRIMADHPSCYNITVWKDDNWGDYFFYGGPGRNPNCP